MIQIVCVKWGNKYSASYVNILFDMIRRNLLETTKFQFICFTDDASGLNEAIETRKLPNNLEGWWNKLWLFSYGAGLDGQVFYFDLDTVIVGELDSLLAYRGRFAILRDFYRPNGLQSSVMSWQAGDYAIWEGWIAAKRPILPGGDQEWVERVVKAPDIWQELYPRAFVSYKIHCQGRRMPPKGSRLVIFHGNPRPHEAFDAWMYEIWKEGGGTLDGADVECNTQSAALIENIRWACEQPYKRWETATAHDGHAVIVGGGPSLKTCLAEIKQRQALGQKIFALNNSAKFLASHGIRSDYQVLLDARPGNAEFEMLGETMLIASQCHRDVFAKAKNIELWHSHTEEAEDTVPDDRHVQFVSAGSTVGLSAMCLAYGMGYRKLHLYGFDSSFEENHHAYEQKANDDDRVVMVKVGEREFKTTPWMYAQTNQFQHLAATLANGDCLITVHGDGLLPYVAKKLMEFETDGEFKKIDGWWFPASDRAAAQSVLEYSDDVDEILTHTKGRKLALQAGGNVGVWPQKLAESFTDVITLEPDRENFTCLEMNVTAKNVRSINAALGDARGKAGLSRDESNIGAHYIVDGEEFTVMRIDDLRLPSCDLICLDIEGYELNALKGGVKTIEKFKPTIVCEDKGLSLRYGSREGDIAEFLAHFGYRPIAKLHRDVVFTIT